MKNFRWRIAVIGSQRTAESSIYCFENEHMFAPLAAGVGTWIARAGQTLRVGWSNDHILSQARPERDGLQEISHNLNGTLAAKPSDCRFLFEHAADFHAFSGYLAAVAQGDARGTLELDISDAMLNGATEKNTLSWEPVGNRYIGNATIYDHIKAGVIHRSEIEGRREKEFLRSKYLSQLIEQGADREVDLVIALGGGKATGLVLEAAKERLKLLPLPFCGGEACRFFTKEYAESNTLASERLRYVFGHDMPEMASHYTESMVSELLRPLDKIDNFFCYPYRVFVALPYGKEGSKEEKEQDEIFKIIHDAINDIVKGSPKLYPGAGAIRVDKAIIGTKEIHQEMWNLILNSGVIMGELTPAGDSEAPNANVYYELGFGDGAYRRKPNLLTMRKGTNLPFDLGNKKVYKWENLNELKGICKTQFSCLFEAIRTKTWNVGGDKYRT